MTKTTTELAARVLERLRVTAAGETPTAEDSATVTNYYAGIFAEETVNGLFYWDQADIPDEAFEALADFLAGRLAYDFAMPTASGLEITGMNRLRKLSQNGPTGLTVTGSYF